jgi:mono/diheme cytochrome c family protein
MRWIGLGLFATALTLQPHDQAAGRPADGAVAAGLNLAKRHCSGCHAIADGPSPLPDAPPFARLHHRYGAGCLDALLHEGMLSPLRPPEEGGSPRHPRMPMAVLDDDEQASLRAYLHSLDPRRDPPIPRCGPHQRS